MLHLLADIIIKAPAFVHQEVEVRANFGKFDKDMRALDHARINHANKPFVPVVVLGRHRVLLFLQVRPRMMHEEARVKLAMVQSVLFDGVGNAPDPVQLPKTVKLSM